VNVIFLDFDGVLNSRKWWESEERASMTGHSPHGNSLRNIDRAAVIQLLRIVKETGAKIVISSSWRSYHGRNTKGGISLLRWILAERGLRCASKIVIGCTPDLQGRTYETGIYVGKARGHEIRAWMDGQSVDRFVVLDDERHDMESWPELVKNGLCGRPHRR